MTTPPGSARASAPVSATSATSPSLPSSPASPSSPSSAADAAHAARSGLLQVLMAFGQVFFFLNQFLISRLYGAAVYGVYVTSVGLLDVLTRGGYFGADKSLLRYVAAHRIGGEPELEERALGSGLRLATGVSALLAVCLVLGAGPIATFQGKPELGGMLRLMAPAVVAGALTRVLAEAMLGAKVVRMNLYVRGLGDPTLLCACTLGGAVLGAGALRLAAAHVIAACCTTSLAAVAAAHVFSRAKLRRSLAAPPHPELVRFATPMGLSEVLNAMLQRADVILLGFFVSREEVGIYAAAEFIGRIIAAIRGAFDSITGPVVAEALKTGDRRRLHYNLSLMIRWVTLVSAFISVTVVALRREILSLYGPLFGAGAGCLVVLALTHFINTSLGLIPWVIIMSGRSRLLLINNLGAAILNVTLNLLLVPAHGILGAALAAFLSVTTLQIVFLAETWWLERIHPFSLPFLKILVAAALAGLAEHTIASRLPGGVGLRVATLVLAGGLTYALALVALGLGDEERRALERVLRTLRLRRAP